MKKILRFSLSSCLLLFLFFSLTSFVKAADPYKLQISPIPCVIGDCPTQLQQIYKNEPCVSSYDEFLKNPLTQHFWTTDLEITSQGKSNERARQFLYWVFDHPAIDDHPVLKSIWAFSRNIVFYLIILVAAIMGIGIIISQRTNFDFKVKVWPVIIRLAVLLLYISFSATIIFFLIQISEILMKFFIEQLGGRDLFNIYFSTVNGETSYVNFVGCRDLNFKVQEAVGAELFLIKVTNVVYYILGSMLILRKVILWFLLFVSPFLAILIPFAFIRNVGWIWIGVFFQWLFYGPLLALFLSCTAIIWKAGIPFQFAFSRINTVAGYIYPTGINIVYGGPAQIAASKINAFNNGNYVDTFAEYVISLIMLLAVTFFPWWLLRIFRDYCCDGIYAAKNILLSMYDQMRGGPSPTPPTFSPSSSLIGTSLKMPRGFEIPVKVHLETMEEIKKTKTEDITRSLNISTKKLTDIASFETNKQVQQTVKQNIDYLANPMKADTPAQRQKFMNLRTELFSRAVKDDQAARQVLSSISSSKLEQLQRRQQLAKSIPKMVSVSHILSVKIKMPQEKVSAISSFLVNTISANTQLINSLAQTVNLQVQQIQTILHLLAQSVNQPTTNLTKEISQQTNLDNEKVTQVLKSISLAMKTNKQLLETVSQKESVEPATLAKFVEEQLAVLVEPEKYIAETISIPPTVPIEEYESVKKMWQKQYEQGEVPVTENIKSRPQWVEQDTVFITNTLNKLVSSNEQLRLAGLDDLGYILPIFLINNMQGEELLVYLKAKLEAAKAVAEQLTKEKEISEKLKSKSEEEFVEVAAPKKEEAKKTLEMKEELKVEN